MLTSPAVRRAIACCTLVISVAGVTHAQVAAPLGERAETRIVGTTADQLPSADDGRTPGGSSQEGVAWLLGSSLRDFAQLPSKETAAVLAIGAAGSWIGGSFGDRSTSRLLSQARTLEPIMEAGQTIGGARLQLVGALATYGIGRASRSQRTTAIGGDLLRAQLLSQALTAGLKMSVRRTRPDGTQFSFPSGHSSVTFASATVLQRHLGPKVGIPAYAIATYVAASRVQERRHFLSDVAFGAAVGIAAGRTVTIGRGARRFALAPTAVPGGMGVSLALVQH